MPYYHFLTRQKEEMPVAEIVEYADDDAAIDEARRVMGDALREAAVEGRLLDEEIEVCRDDGTVIAVVVCDGSSWH
jgi:hypothetical protein